MEVVEVSATLAPAGLKAPILRALIPNEQNYSVLMLQPNGYIHADANGVRNGDRQLAAKQFGAFLTKAHQDEIDLVITPEYSTPWSVVVDIVKSGAGPNEGALWCLGCESLKYSELEEHRHELAPHAQLVYEPLQTDGNHFVSPLAYVFRSPRENSNESALVVLIQFKTHPMSGDNDHFEINALARGTKVYSFGGNHEQIRLVSLICSDVLQFTDANSKSIYDRALIIHIQLNPKPRHAQFKPYRSKLFGPNGDATELVCVNWARDVQLTFKDKTDSWKNISGTAWYLKPTGFDARDPALIHNHRNGLYYTWCPSLRVHVLFLNFSPAVFRITATKVFHHNVVSVQSRRIGPRLVEMLTWSDKEASWKAGSADDHFSSLFPFYGDAKDAIKELANDNPFNAERVLALAAGQIGTTERWHDVQELDSCSILESETIRRLTFCQDDEPEALNFRQQRVGRLRRLWSEILSDASKLPPSLSDLVGGKKLHWSVTSPHQNLLSNGGKLATAIYLGEDVTLDQAKNVKTRAAEYLRRSSSSHDHEVECKQRLAVWFRDQSGNVVLTERDQYVTFTDPRTGSAVDLARSQ